MVVGKLFVDDEKDIMKIMHAMLERAGYSVTSTSNLLQALEMIKMQNYDLVLLDIRMPVMDGLTLCEKMRKVNDRIKVCFLTAFEIDVQLLIRERFPYLREECFVRKPVLPKSLR